MSFRDLHTGFRTASNRLSSRSKGEKTMSLRYLGAMTTEQVDVRSLLATSLVTGIDHVGIAVADLDAAIAWYHDHLGMVVVHEEVNEDQEIREAMLTPWGASLDSAMLQLMAPLNDSSV